MSDEPCASDHTWTSYHDGTPDYGTPCDCGQKKWGIPLVKVREHEWEFYMNGSFLQALRSGDWEWAAMQIKSKNCSIDEHNHCSGIFKTAGDDNLDDTWRCECSCHKNVCTTCGGTGLVSYQEGSDVYGEMCPDCC